MSFGVETVGSNIASGALGSLGSDLSGAVGKLIADSLTGFGLDFGKLAQGLAEAAKLNPAGADQAFAAVNARLSPVEQGQLLAAKDKAPAAAAKAAPAAAATPAAAKAAASKGADFAVPKSPAAAPKTLRFSAANQKVFNNLWSQSFPAGKSKEQGGTLAFDKKTGTVSIQNLGGSGSTSGSFSPNNTLNDPKKDAVLGAFHTHPYDKTEGSYTGVSLSGGDAAYMINEKHNLIVAQSGTKQFMYLRTAKTPAHVDFNALNDAQNARIGVLTSKGMDFAVASRQAASETATKYHLAYYEGSNGTLTRVNPK